MTCERLANHLQNMIPSQLQTCCSESWEYFAYTRNPWTQVFYSLLIVFGYTTYAYTAFPYVSDTFLGRLPFYILLVNFMAFALCSLMDPGVINSSNVEKYMKQYPREERMCRTCMIPKPARSKHCAVCNHCVSRFDHHCSWVNNCIGQRNLPFFILFLITLVLMTGVSAFLVAMVFIHITNKRQLHMMQYTDKYGNVFKASLPTVISFLMGEYTLMSFLLIFLTTIFFVLTGFTGFHMFLLLTNRTTNELCSKKNKYKECDVHNDSCNRTNIEDNMEQIGDKLNGRRGGTSRSDSSKGLKRRDKLKSRK